MTNANPTKRVWKFELALDDTADVGMPRHAESLRVMVQYGSKVTLWALVDPEKPSVVRRFYVYGTGSPILNADMKNYVDSVMLDGFVWHVFDGGEIASVDDGKGLMGESHA